MLAIPGPTPCMLSKVRLTSEARLPTHIFEASPLQSFTTMRVNCCTVSGASFTKRGRRGRRENRAARSASDIG